MLFYNCEWLWAHMLHSQCKGCPKVTTLPVQHLIFRIDPTNHCHTHHVSNFEVPVREDYSVWRRSNRQHEGERGTQGTRHHDVQWIDPNGLRLQKWHGKHQQSETWMNIALITKCSTSSIWLFFCRCNHWLITQSEMCAVLCGEKTLIRWV